MVMFIYLFLAVLSYTKPMTKIYLAWNNLEVITAISVFFFFMEKNAFEDNAVDPELMLLQSFFADIFN